MAKTTGICSQASAKLTNKSFDLKNVNYPLASKAIVITFEKMAMNEINACYVLFDFSSLLFRSLYDFQKNCLAIFFPRKP